MFKHTTVKKSLILLVAALMCVAVFLAACSEKPFTSNFVAPKGEQVDSNGGIAVRYGDYIYYVNGYASDVNAANTYADVKDAPRVGSVVRIHKDKLAEIIAINDDDTLTSAQKTENVAKAVRENAQTVVPKIFFTANTANAQNNGIYIFNDRLYILTPNDKLTANGDKLTNQSVLMSFDLAGGDMQRHFTFANNTVQLWFTEEAGKLSVTYLDGSELHVLELGANEKSTKDVAIKTDGETDTAISSVRYDEADKCLFFIDGNGSVCKLALGKTEQEVLVNNAVADGKDESTFSYSIKSVSNGYVYFTIADSDNPDVDNLVLYYASSSDKVTEVGGAAKVAIDNAQNLTVYGWKANSVVYMGSKSNQSGNYTGYGISIITTDGENRAVTKVLLPGWSKESIAINKIVGDVLYFTAGGVTYQKNLADFVGTNAEGSAEDLGTPYATSWSTEASVGWAAPDLITIDGKTYMFTFGTGSISVVEFDAVKKTNGASTALTFTAEPQKD